MKPLNQTVLDMKPSGIRKFFDIVSEMPKAISLGVGEPDFDTPWHISDEGIYTLEKGRTFYTSNSGLMELRKEIGLWYEKKYGIHRNPVSEILITVGGSEGIDLALRALLSPGDEVIIPEPSYVSYVPCVSLAGGVPVTLPLKNENCFKLTAEELESAITEKTKAIVPVDLGGIVCDYDRIFEIVEKKRSLFKPMESDGTPLSDLSAAIQRGLGCIAVVSDCAHSLGANRVVSYIGKGKIKPVRRYCGRIAHFSSFSFHAVKNYTTAEGGASTWCLPQSVYDEGVTDAQIYKMYQLLSLHGQNKDALAKTKVGAWEYDIIGPWYKCNMTDIMAAIGLRQLDRYLGLLDRRVEMMAKYDQACDELGISHMVHHTENMDSSNHLYLIRIPDIGVEERNTVIEKMAERGVATNVHYKPMPMMTAYKALGWDIKDFPNTYDYYHNLITLPFHTLLSDEDVEFVVQTLKEVVGEVRGC